MMIFMRIKWGILLISIIGGGIYFFMNNQNNEESSTGPEINVMFNKTNYEVGAVLSNSGYSVSNVDSPLDILVLKAHSREGYEGHYFSTSYVTGDDLIGGFTSSFFAFRLDDEGYECCKETFFEEGVYIYEIYIYDLCFYILILKKL